MTLLLGGAGKEKLAIKDMVRVATFSMCDEQKGGKTKKENPPAQKKQHKNKKEHPHQKRKNKKEKKNPKTTQPGKTTKDFFKKRRPIDYSTTVLYFHPTHRENPNGGVLHIDKKRGKKVAFSQSPPRSHDKTLKSIYWANDASIITQVSQRLKKAPLPSIGGNLTSMTASSLPKKRHLKEEKNYLRMSY